MEQVQVRRNLADQPFSAGVSVERACETELLLAFQRLDESVQIALHFTSKGELVSLMFMYRGEPRALHAFKTPLFDRGQNEAALASLLGR